jgi:hypothetical protein
MTTDVDSKARTQRITLRLTPDDLLRLKAFATHRDVAPAELAATVMHDYLHDQGEPPGIYFYLRSKFGRE